MRKRRENTERTKVRAHFGRDREENKDEKI